MRTFAEIIELIKETKNLKKDKEVAVILQIEYKRLATAKSRNSLPYEELITFCNKENISLNWLLTNQGNKKIGDQSREYKATPDTELSEIVQELKENPNDKKLILKLLKGKKDIKEALEGLSSKDMLNNLEQAS